MPPLLVLWGGTLCTNSFASLSLSCTSLAPRACARVSHRCRNTRFAVCVCMHSGIGSRHFCEAELLAQTGSSCRTSFLSLLTSGTSERCRSEDTQNYKHRTSIFVCVRVCVCVWLHVCGCVCMCVHMHASMRACIRASMCSCQCICAHACARVSVHARTDAHVCCARVCSCPSTPETPEHEGTRHHTGEPFW
jgi:hypothetical protein